MGRALLNRLNPVAEPPIWCKNLFALDLKVAEPRVFGPALDALIVIVLVVVLDFGLSIGFAY